MPMQAQSLKLRTGDWVEVRSEAEILATLDDNGELDRLPFMPEMLKYCGQRFQVFRSAHKTCDTVHKTGGRRMANAVHLSELRCDGSAHGNCQADCLFFWKEAWLKPVESEASAPGAHAPRPATPRCTKETLFARTVVPDSSDGGTGPTYSCQTTRLPDATTPLQWWDVRQYWQDYRSGNVGLGRIAASFLYSRYVALSRAGVGLGRPMRWLYDKFQAMRNGVPFPRRSGSIPEGQPTPAVTLNLQPGEVVRVKKYDEILATLDETNRNRGLYFDCEEVPFCGGEYRVKSRVFRIINERTGKMMEMKTPSVILDGVYCQARYSDKRLFCPRSISPMWREIWLERVDGPASAAPPQGVSNATGRSDDATQPGVSASPR